MRFRVVDVDCTSRSVQFTFSNDGTYQLTVCGTRSDGNLFAPYGLYESRVAHEVAREQMSTLHGSGLADVYSKLGVVTRCTRQAIHVASGHTKWRFPRLMASFKPGTDVWITVRTVLDKRTAGDEIRTREGSAQSISSRSP